MRIEHLGNDKQQVVQIIFYNLHVQIWKTFIYWRHFNKFGISFRKGIILFNGII